MQRVKLYTRDEEGFVVAGMVPPFLEGHEADILVWGERMFMLRRNLDGEAAVDDEGDLLYREAFGVALVNTEPPA